MGSIPTKLASSTSSQPKGLLEKTEGENGRAAAAAATDMDRQRPTDHRNPQADTTARQGAPTKRDEGECKGGSSGNVVFGMRPPADEDTVDGWPMWLVKNVPRRVLEGLVPKSAESYHKINKIGQGTYSNVYKARDRETGKLVALKKVRFDTSEPESIKFMAREIMILRELDHPNIVRLEGLATSRMHFSLYLVFDYMVSDLQRLIAGPNGQLTEPQIKRYMQQMLSGLKHCHEKGILHRDIKGSNLLIDRSGTLKIGDFGLANYYRPRKSRPLTNRVVTLWYRAPELLLGATDYGVGIDLWSAGCLLAEMLAGRPILPGGNEVEQLHLIFKLCGAPMEEYWRNMKVSKTFRPRQAYRARLMVSFSGFPDKSIALLSSLLALDPLARGSAASLLEHEFFHSFPLPCDPSELPVVYQEEDELASVSEQKMCRRSKAKRRAHAQRDAMGENPATRNSELKKEEWTGQVQEGKQEPECSTNSSFLGLKQNQSSQWAPSSTHSADIPEKISGGSLGGNVENYLPVLPTSRLAPSTSARYNKEIIDGMCRLKQVSRSASSRDFRKPNQGKHLQRYDNIDV
ncbi:hypothetical protein SAY86_009722 [Trapa natans]|uniref:Protein kinase domain-containing protein n=1 Tax=Trapa natans TaxID=22666 RepID=A0AAN7L5C1_TRANT|nr:hypothetical protein SAY86_009722 [Trapa natans]